MVCIVQITDNEASLTQNRPICGSRGLRSVTGSLMFAGQGSGNCGGPKTLSSSVRFSFSTPVGQAPVHPPIMMVQQPQPPPPPPQQQTIIMGGAPAAEATGDCPICKISWDNDYNRTTSSTLHHCHSASCGASSQTQTAKGKLPTL
ncbi:uncharacterized protein LOC123504596 isoform X2 [Portunus trituberculatus]|uniref:uncharacterized protein LOC123504596 isoform X2 n=1 Tax=Portunus trituberculatus TaxID=210409 RepID=UPI001E1CD3CE|nr:uncharacterized protein LOC123504596 isoform X2 [Portunus trituberculatus]